MEMKSLVVFVLCGVSFAAVADGLTCFAGMTGSVTKYPCPVGRCGNLTDIGNTFYACVPQQLPVGCRVYEGRRYCICNTDLCNYPYHTFQNLFIELLKNGFNKNGKLTFQ